MSLGCTVSSFVPLTSLTWTKRLSRNCDIVHDSRPFDEYLDEGPDCALDIFPRLARHPFFVENLVASFSKWNGHSREHVEAFSCKICSYGLATELQLGNLGEVGG